VEVEQKVGEQALEADQKVVDQASDGLPESGKQAINSDKQNYSF
jgi:hypothetical protein